MKQLIFSLSFFLIISGLFTTTPALAGTRGIAVKVKTYQGEYIDLYKGSFALVLGNSRYKKGMDPLPGVRRDVRDVVEVLKKNGFEVTLKTDLSKLAFQRAVAEFVARYGKDPENRLLFYYAGHGYTEQTATDEELGYLVMVDAPNPVKDEIGFKLASLDMQYFVTQAKLIQSKHVLFLFDSCFSGSILNFRASVRPKSIADSVRYPVRQFITAGRANEPVPDRSVFKQAFVDLLEGKAPEPIPDGYLTGEELGLYLKNKVPEYNPYQHPQYGKIRDINLDKGDFVFVINHFHAAAKLEAEKKRRIMTEERKALEREKVLLEKEKKLAEERRRLDKKQAEIDKLDLQRQREALEKEKALLQETKRLEKERQELVRLKSELADPKPTDKKTAPVLNPKEPWTGTWEIKTTKPGHFTVFLVQKGNNVTSIKGSDKKMKGKVKGDRLKGFLPRAMRYTTFDLKLSSDGRTLNGTSYTHGKGVLRWKGVKINSARF